MRSFALLVIALLSGVNCQGLPPELAAMFGQMQQMQGGPRPGGGPRIISVGGPRFVSGGLPFLPRGGMPMGMPVVVMRGSFGFDPWDDLHHNMERQVRRAAHQPNLLEGPASGAQAVARPLGMRLGSLLDAFGGQHHGHVGRANGGFEVDDDHHSRFRVTAMLPGYNLGANAQMGADPSKSPLSVRVVGRRSLVVNGLQQTGPAVMSWQRSFKMPRGAEVEKISVTYSSSTGNLTVDVPRPDVSNRELSEQDEEDEEDEDDDDDAGVPPILRAIRSALPGIISQLEGGHLEGRRGGFMLPGPDAGDLFQQMHSKVEGLHPRYHGPEGGDRPVPDTADVNFVGCFAESQLEKATTKYYGDGNGASFASMYWHAEADHAPFFGMGRHDRPIGHAFTFKNFSHEHEIPQWGQYEGCGSRCEDDSSRWCGCASESERGFYNSDCEPDEKRFAVYKISKPLPQVVANESAVLPSGTGPPEPLSQENAGLDALEVSPTPTGAASAAGRPYWQLSGAADEIEIVCPEGTVALGLPQGRQVKCGNSTGAAAGADAQKDDTPRSLASVASDAASAPSQEDAGASPTAQPQPVSKVKLPVGVIPEDCAMDALGKIKCKLDKGQVRNVPIRLIDEL